MRLELIGLNHRTSPLEVREQASMSPEQVLDLAETLDPDQEPGRLTFIHRFGRDQLGARGAPADSSLHSPYHPTHSTCPACLPAHSWAGCWP